MRVTTAGIEFRYNGGEAAHAVRVGTVRIIAKDGTVQELTLTEFAERLRRTNGPDARWGDAILELADVEASHKQLISDIEEAVPVQPGQAYGDAVHEAAKLGDRVRDVLVETGALGADDTETDPVALLRALLS